MTHIKELIASAPRVRVGPSGEPVVPQDMVGWLSRAHVLDACKMLVWLKSIDAFPRNPHLLDGDTIPRLVEGLEGVKDSLTYDEVFAQIKQEIQEEFRES